MPDDTLHAAIEAEIDRLEWVAKAANGQFPGPWRHDHRHKWMYDVGGNHIDSADSALGSFMAANAPDLVLRGLAEDRDILRRHDREPFDDEDCRCGWVLAECPDLLSLARRHGINTEATT